MSYKLFPLTYGGDRLRLVFDCEEERYAFEQAIESIRLKVEENKPRESRIDFQFNTTLEMEVARDHADEVSQIAGLQVLNFFSDRRAVIIPLPSRL